LRRATSGIARGATEAAQPSIPSHFRHGGSVNAMAERNACNKAMLTARIQSIADARAVRRKELQEKRINRDPVAGRKRRVTAILKRYGVPS
jgi:hypothetical protein